MSTVIYVNDWDIYFMMIRVLRYDIEKLILGDWKKYTKSEKRQAGNIKKIIAMMMRRIAERDTQKLACDLEIYRQLRQMQDLAGQLYEKIFK